MNKCGTCKHYTGAGDFDLCCSISARRLCYENYDACDKYEENPIKHRYYVVRDNEVIAHYNDNKGIHPVYVISLMSRDLSERMEKADVDNWNDAIPNEGDAQKAGHWTVLEYCSNSGIYCSECNTKIFDFTTKPKKKLSQYCPHCGSKNEQFFRDGEIVFR